MEIFMRLAVNVLFCTHKFPQFSFAKVQSYENKFARYFQEFCVRGGFCIFFTFISIITALSRGLYFEIFTKTNLSKSYPRQCEFFS